MGNWKRRTSGWIKSGEIGRALTEHQVHGAEDEGQIEALGSVDFVTGHDVAETYGRQGDEAEIRAVQHVPVLPFGKQDGSAPNIPEDHPKILIVRNCNFLNNFSRFA